MKFNIVKFKPKQIKGLECLNCGQPLLGNENFCSYCGQKNSIKKLNFDSFLTNLFSGFFSYDSRFWRTFIPLLTKPGKVSKDYIEGKRVRFVNPFQLYLNVSIIFFLLLGISNRMDTNNVPDNILTFNISLDSISQQGTQQLDSALTSVKDQVVKFSPNDSTNIGVVTDLSTMVKLIESETKKVSRKYVYHIKTDTVNKIGVFKRLNDFQHYHDSFPKYTNEQGLDSLGYKKTFWNKLFYQQVMNTTSNIKQLKTKEGVNNLVKKLTSYISISLFVFLPVFTLFLKLLYIRRKFTYMEHLVFVFHTQTIFFLLLLIFILLNFFVSMQSMWWVVVLLFLLYLYKALRHFYQQGRFKTLVKYMLLNSYYLFLATIGFTIVAILSFLVR